MGQVIDIFSRQGLEKDFSGASDIYLESSAVSGKNRVLFWMGGEYREYMTLAEAVAFDVVKGSNPWPTLVPTIANLPRSDT